MRLDQTSSDSQCSPTDELSSKGTAADLIETIEPSSPTDTADTSQPISDTKSFEQAGVFITDDEITVDVSNTTGLRKTGYSDNLYSDDLVSPKKSLTKIPRSPMTRRKSFDSSSVHSDIASTNAPSQISRKMPVYRSVRKAMSPQATESSATTGTKQDNGTWSGRSIGTKKRASLGSESFQPLNKASNNTGSSTNLSNQKVQFQRNSDLRSSKCQYDQNGRRIAKSTTTSPIKQSASTSPLAQQILEAAESAKNDSQMLEKMKLLLSKYTVNKTKTNGSPNRSRSTATPSPIKNKDDFEDFTTAWVNSNGSLDRASNCCAANKVHSKRSSAASSCDSNAYGKGEILVAARRERGVSRIPAPIRQNTELY